MTDSVIARAYVELLPRLENFGQQSARQIKTALNGATGAIDQSTNGVKKQITSTGDHVTKTFTGAEKGVARSAGRMQKGFQNTMAGFKGMVAPAVAAFSVLGSIGIAKSAIQTFQDTGIEVIKLQRVAGGTAEEMSRLREAAVLAGIQVPTLTTGMRLLSKTLVNTEGNSKATAKMTALLGFNFQDAHGKVKPMAALLPQLADKFKSMPAGPQKTALAMKLFGRSGTEMLPFLNKGSEGIKLLEAQSDKLGTTMSGKSLQSIIAYRSQQRQFAATMLGVKLAIGGALLPTLTKIGTSINGFIGQMRSGNGIGGRFAAIMKDIASQIGSGISFIRDNAKMLTILAGVVLTITAYVKAYNTALRIQAALTAAGGILGYIKSLQLVRAATAAWTAVQWLLNSALFANPIGIAVLAIAALVAGVIIAYKHSERFRQIVDAAFKAVKNGASTVINFFANNWKRLPLLLLGPVGLVLFVFKGLPGQILKAVGNFASLLWDKGKDLMNGLKNGIWAVAQGVGAWILRAPVVKFIAPWLFAAVWLIYHGKQLIEGFKKGIWAVASTVGKWLNTNVIQPAIKVFSAVGSWLYNHGKNLVLGLERGVVAIARSIGSWLWSNVVRPLINTFGPAISWLVNAGRSVVNGLKNGIIAIARTVGSWVWNNVVRPIVGTFSKAGTWLYNLGGSVIGGLKSGIWNAMKGIGSWVKTSIVDPMIKAVKWFFGIKSPSTVMAGIGVNMIKGLFGGMSIGNVKQAVGKVFGGLPQALGSIVNKGLVSIKGLPGKALNALKSLGGLFGGIGSDSLAYKGGAGVEQWRAIALQALKAAGAPSNWVGSLLRRMNQESSGNPNAINLTDSNAQAGHPSQGLMQTIPSTFYAYAGQYASRGITDPFANIYASIKYANARYGAAPRGWDRKGGYGVGAWNISKDHIAGIHEGEMIFPAAVANNIRKMVSGRGPSQAGRTENHVHNEYHFPNYVGDKRDLVKAIDQLRRERRI